MFPYLQQAGLYGAALIGFMKIDNALITALVERWRPETHTFHIPEGECTITLEDVEVLMGLKVDGLPIVGQQEDDWAGLCAQLLGVVPSGRALRGNRLRTAWLNSTFGMLPVNATDEVVVQYTRAYMLKLMGGILFPDKNTSTINLWMLQFIDNFERCGTYSWGSAVLAHVYRELCKASCVGTMQIAGCMTLVQLWAYERFPRISPTITQRPVRGHAMIFTTNTMRPRGYVWTHAKYNEKVGALVKEYRREIESTGPGDFVWRPYQDIVAADEMPGVDIYRAVVPLIGFSIVEWHQPDRVMRQFGRRQHIPSPPLQDPILHQLDARKNVDGDWSRYYNVFIRRWQYRRGFTVHGVVDNTSGSLDYASEYMTWYRSITRRWITKVGAKLVQEVDNLRKCIGGDLSAPEAPCTFPPSEWVPPDSRYNRPRRTVVDDEGGGDDDGDDDDDDDNEDDEEVEGGGDNPVAAQPSSFSQLHQLGGYYSFTPTTVAYIPTPQFMPPLTRFQRSLSPPLQSRPCARHPQIPMCTRNDH